MKIDKNSTQSNKISSLSESAKKILLYNIYPFWENHVIDKEHGGFYGRISADGKHEKRASKSLIFNTRLLWGYTKAYKHFKKDIYFKLANRAYYYLKEYFYDAIYGGFFWMVNETGQVAIDKKLVYGQSFVIYSLSEYYDLTKNPLVKKIIDETVELMENKCRDILFGGYREAFSRDWILPDKMRISSEGINECKAQNTHLHILEAYTNYYRYVNPQDGKKRLEYIIRIITEKIIRKEEPALGVFFGNDWKEIGGYRISCGHDIEGSWLLWKALLELGNEELMRKWKPTIEQINLACLGYCPDNFGMIFERREYGVDIKERHWWVQAEAVIGFLNAYQISGHEIFLEKSLEIWTVITEEFISEETGEWFAFARSDTKKSNYLADEWKAFYHNSRACLEIMKRCQTLSDNRYNN